MMFQNMTPSEYVDLRLVRMRYGDDALQRFVEYSDLWFEEIGVGPDSKPYVFPGSNK